MLRIDPELGVGVRLLFQAPGSFRVAKDEDLAQLRTLGAPISSLLHRNLSRVLREAPILAVGDPVPVVTRRNLGQGAFWGPASGEAPAGETGASFLLLDTSLPGVEAILLLPEFWDLVGRALGRPIWVALPDRGHCRILPAGPWRMLVEMGQELHAWHSEASEPLFGSLLYRDGEWLRGATRLSALGSR